MEPGRAATPPRGERFDSTVIDLFALNVQMSFTPCRGEGLICGVPTAAPAGLPWAKFCCRRRGIPPRRRRVNAGLQTRGTLGGEGQ